MYGSLKTLAVSRDPGLLKGIEDALSGALGRNLRTRLVVNGHTDPLHGVDCPCDVLILHLGPTWREELESLVRMKPEARPGLIVIGDASSTQAMRLSMQAGARDFLPLPLVADDLIDAIARAALDQKAALEDRRTRVTAVINSNNRP
jgi:pilus assembly protein CpaE